ncbi:MAG TPA: aminomethyl-transferring glycine dehydrogenase subunit GcvPA [Burkholderiales bacterium]|nr:aminomethyl-transferring glycine dehydrogenase subunit GcvPA [Burkholderiales bacterium]
MPFIPHTEADIRDMLAEIGAQRIETLFDEIPDTLKTAGLPAIPPGMSEMEVTRLMHGRARRDDDFLNFIGAGAYEHHIPAAVWQIATRGEFYSAYTPYQAEASQGTLQLLYEYQTMMCSLTGLDATNASLYDGASALAEAVLMAVRLHKSARRILMPVTVHPTYRKTVRDIVSNQDVQVVEVACCTEEGRILPAAVKAAANGEYAALVVPQPNFFGRLEDVDALTDLAHASGALAIACVNPTSLALLKPPGKWGSGGADIAVGEGQPLGVPLANGGPYFGFMACRQSLVRQMPGRIVGRTVDLDGRPGFALTLQAREQHIRRSKATSNICTNQGLTVTAATIYLAMLGPEGLKRVACASHANTVALVESLARIPGVRPQFSGPVFHEAVVALPQPAAQVLAGLRAHGILGGLDLSGHYPELGDAMLVCATETKTPEDIRRYAEALADCLRAAA